jgi:subtilase family serine protease
MFVLAPHQAGSGTAPSFSSTPNGGYSPFQLRIAFSINSSNDTGAGQTIAIVDAYNDPNIFNDLDVFDKQFAPAAGDTYFQRFGAAESFVTVFNQNGQVINPDNTSVPVDTTGNWEQEEALDVEWAHAIAPEARIDLVEANNNGSALDTAVASAASLPGVSVVSMSWGSPEADNGNETGDDGTFTTPAGHTGVTFLAATGDYSAGWYPAFSPNVVAVGGTTLKLNIPSDTIHSETAWSTGSDSWNKTLGTGGGISNFEAEPSYQDAVQFTGMRTIPDVSFDADPNTGVAIYDSFGTSSFSAPGWVEIGGTSLATPAWAGLIAMANQQRAADGLPTLNSISPTETHTLLYGLSGTTGGVAFHDITSGSITANGQTFKAGPGYDDVTGWGSPIANVLVSRLGHTLDVVGDTDPGYPDDSFAINTTASGEFQVTNTNGPRLFFAAGDLDTVNINAGAGINNIAVLALPAGMVLNLDNNTSGHQDSVVIGSYEASLSNIAGTVNVANSGGTTALTVEGTGDGTGRTYQLIGEFGSVPNVPEVQVSGMPGAVFYSGDVNSLTINGGSGNNTFDVVTTPPTVPVTINAGSGTNDVFLVGSNSAVNITGSGTNYVTVGAGGSLATIAGPVNISNTSNGGKSLVTIDDTNDTAGRNYTITSSSIAVQRGPTINLGSTVDQLILNDAVGKANSYTVKSVPASGVLINGDALDTLGGPAADQVVFRNNAHG